MYILMKSVAAAAAPLKPKPDRVASRYVSDVLFHAPLVLFGLQRCETSRAAREFLDRFGIEHRAVELDSADYRKDDFGRRIRTVVAALSGDDALPQMFLVGEPIGGAMQFFESWQDDAFQQRLLGHGINYFRRANAVRRSA